jgi:hypothetical protein
MDKKEASFDSDLDFEDDLDFEGVDSYLSKFLAFGEDLGNCLSEGEVDKEQATMFLAKLLYWKKETKEFFNLCEKCILDWLENNADTTDRLEIGDWYYYGTSPKTTTLTDFPKALSRVLRIEIYEILLKCRLGDEELAESDLEKLISNFRLILSTTSLKKSKCKKYFTDTEFKELWSVSYPTKLDKDNKPLKKLGASNERFYKNHSKGEDQK